MNSFAKYITAKTLQPAIKKYLAKTRVYQYKNISLIIPPEVFHPGFFFSTKILLNYISSLQLSNKRFLELGAGSGLISFVAAKENAHVTATDINSVAVEYLKLNGEKNNLKVEIILSDLFDDISQQQFDIIVINPPYYKKDPETIKDYAWYCGTNGEYFYKLFESLQKYIHDETDTLMIVSEDCDIEMIKDIAGKYSFFLQLVQTKKNILESNFIFSIHKSLMNFSGYTLMDDVYVNNNAEVKNEFEEKYIALRKKENRIYSNHELASLPVIAETHPYYKEWIVRNQSANRLVGYLTKKNKALEILEVGCGNGWLSNFLSQIESSYVVGLDINFAELKQAAKVFKKGNLIFMYDILSEKLLSEFSFDIIVFAASAQYFSSIKQVIKEILPLLNKNGEIHILDTNFYRTDEIDAAKKRTEQYYASLGFPEFSKYYFHHALSELNTFCVDKLYQPSSVRNVFNVHKNPFPWFRIKQEAA